MQFGLRYSFYNQTEARIEQGVIVKGSRISEIVILSLFLFRLALLHLLILRAKRIVSGNIEQMACVVKGENSNIVDGCGFQNG